MNEYTIALIICGLVFGAWIVGLVGFEIWRCVWAWIDDTKPKENWLLTKFKVVPYRSWIYPVYNGEYKKEKEIFGYAKDKEYDKGNVWGLDEGEHYIYSWRKKEVSFFLLFKIVTLTSILPFFALIGYKIYPITIAICLIVLIAYLTRFLRRLSKKFNVHVCDKELHINKEGE